MWKWCCVFALSAVVVNTQFLVCHDDPGFEPSQGILETLQFTWLGILQYINVKNGEPHYFKAPRVVLIHEQFVISTAADAAIVPGGYALGNVVFADYERDEEECGMSIKDIGEGMDCDISVLLMPIADVLLHPEYKHFGTKFSIALLKLVKPVKSYYMLPVCLPLKEFLQTSLSNTTYYHIDHISEVPRDYVEEEKHVTILKFLPRDECFNKETIKNLSITLTCSSDCALSSGAPTIIHEHTGHWTLVAIATGGQPCPDPFDMTGEAKAPQHIMIYPYVSWITSAISGRRSTGSTRDSPFEPKLAVKSSPRVGHTVPGWSGHWWMNTERCYDRGENSDDIFKFYHEVFELKPRMKSNLTYYLQIDASLTDTIVCVKVAVPYRLAVPQVGPYKKGYVKIKLNVLTHKTPYRIQVEAWAVNKSKIYSEEDEFYYFG